MNPGMFLQGLLPTSSDRRARPVSRSGGLLFAAATSVFIYGGSRPTRKGGDSLQILDDLWRARLGSDGNALWEQLTAEGEADHFFLNNVLLGDVKQASNALNNWISWKNNLHLKLR